MAVLLSACPDNRLFDISVAAEGSVDDLTRQKEALAQEQELLAQQRNDAADSLEEQKAQAEIIRKQIDAKSEEIAINGQLLTSLEEAIAAKAESIADQDRAIAALDEEIASLQQSLGIQLRTISQKNSILSFIQLILNSRNFVDYLIGFKMSEQLSRRSETLMQQLEQSIQTAQAARNTLKTDKAALEIEHAQAAAVQIELEDGKAVLQQLYAEANALSDSMFANVEYLDEQIAAMEAEQAALQSSIDYVMEQIRREEEEERRRQEEEEAARREEEETENDTSSEEDPDYEGDSDAEDDSDYEGDSDAEDDSDYENDADTEEDADHEDDSDYEDSNSVEEMLWPTPTCRVITSSFKYREQFGRWHNGLDIACYGDAEGEPIVAAAAGKVRYANHYDTWGGGYGLYMMIDHGYDSEGRRILTVYAHCSEVLVYEGLEVEAGDLIGYVGDTGNSYGAHLHFEVQVDGVAVDPVSNGYLSTEWVDILG